MKGNFNTMSDLSTTVAQPSQQNDTGPRPFIDAANGVITPTKHNYSTNTKRIKKDWHHIANSGFNSPDGVSLHHQNSGLVTQPTKIGQKRYSLIRSVSRTGFKRSSTKSLLNPGGLTHFNFI